MTDSPPLDHGVQDPRAQLLESCVTLQEAYEASTSSEDRKSKGQIFTPPSVARFMASLVTLPSADFRLLDPGAGTGILTAAICERLLQRNVTRRRIELHLFETDDRVRVLLEQNMKRCSKALNAAGHEVGVTIHSEDFILETASRTDAQRGLFGNGSRELPQFNAAIVNPPYFKIRGNSVYARRVASVVHGQPNIYSLFLAQAACLLRPGGQIVAITPRSFCNGLYFREFRRRFFSTVGLERIHLFDSRKHTFKDVLQESVITVSRRLGKSSPTVLVSSSHGPASMKKLAILELPKRAVLDDTSREMIVRIPTSKVDVAIIELAHTWPSRFAQLGLRISTGPVVLFRARQFALANKNGDHVTPLISVHNVHPFETIWPVDKNGKPTAFEVTQRSMRLLVPTKNYVLLRRFSAKEERRRLTASPFLSTMMPGPYRALENHLNYVYHAERDLTVDETFGLVAIFNSVLFDRYFRTFSGNTQVNATEIRTLPFPDLAAVARIGERVRRLECLPSPQAETAVFEELGVQRVIKKELEGLAV